MGQFKPMVKMYTDEPSVILKLKKGGKVKHQGKRHEEHHAHGGHKPMHHAHGGMHAAFESEAGNSPKKPSVAARRKAMNPQLYKKGGKVAHKQLGGGMPMAPNPQALQAAAVKQALVKQAMAKQALAKRALARQALAGQAQPQLGAASGNNLGLKKGGSASCAKVEKELKHHEAMSAKRAHGMKKKASGGAIDSAETRTTLKNSTKPFAKTKMEDGRKHDKVHGTGEVKEGKPAGYKLGGTIEGNEGKFAKTKMDDSSKADRKHGTGEVVEGKPAGYRKGGSATGVGRAIEGNEGRFTNNNVDDGDHFDPAHGTGGVRESNAGGYRKGGRASKKAFATGGQVIDDGKAELMPRRRISPPVANTMQSGTFKRGGKVR